MTYFCKDVLIKAGEQAPNNEIGKNGLIFGLIYLKYDFVIDRCNKSNLQYIIEKNLS